MNKHVFLPIFKELVGIAFPLSSGRILHVLANVIAMMMVAKLGFKPLAAGTLAISSFLMIQTSTISIFYAIGIRIRYFRAGDETETQIGILIKNAVFLALLLAIMAALALSCMDKFLLLLGQDPHLVALTKDYFYFAGFGVLSLLSLAIISQFYIGIGKTYFPLMVELCNLPLTVILAYGFVLGNFGLPKLGLGGVSLAGALSQTTIVLITILSIYFRGLHDPYGLFRRPFAPRWDVCLSLLKLGLPIGIQFGGELVAIAMASYLMGYLGVDPLAALQVTNQFSIVVIMLNLGLGQSLSLLTSEIHGKRGFDVQSIKHCFHVSVVIFLMYIIPIMILFCMFSLSIAQFYLGDHPLDPYFSHLVKNFFYFAAVYVFMDGLRNLLSGILRGLQDTQAPSRINLLSLWGVSLPIAWVCAFLLDGGPLWLRAGFLSGVLVAVLFLIKYLRNKVKLVNEKATLR